jgi:hypothetical protein
MAAECSTSFEAARIGVNMLFDATITRRTRRLWQRQKLQACRKDTVSRTAALSSWIATAVALLCFAGPTPDAALPRDEFVLRLGPPSWACAWTPSRSVPGIPRQQSVEHVRHCQDVSQRRACQFLGQTRSSQRYQPREDPQQEQRLVARMHELAAQYPRYGYRMIGRSFVRRVGR